MYVCTAHASDRPSGINYESRVHMTLGIQHMYLFYYSCRLHVPLNIIKSGIIKYRMRIASATII
jgi:hypothetical protein